MIGPEGVRIDSPGSVAARRWSRGKIAAVVIASAIGAGAIADALFHLRPIAVEKFWVVGLYSGITPLQDAAVFRLRNYPTRDAAVALVFHIRARVKASDFGSAARAADTLAILAGRSWKNVQPGQWPEVLAQIEQWAERHLGAQR